MPSRWTVQNFDTNGDPKGPPKVEVEPTPNVAVAVRKALTMNNVVEVELHYVDGTSRAFRKAGPGQ
jgi:hypothetical protein